MVGAHPRQQLVLDSLPSQPIGLRAHRERIADLGDRIDCRITRQRADDLVRDSADVGLELGHAPAREEWIDDRAKRRVLRRVERVGHHAAPRCVG